jgi:16S rRNA (cytosine1402-N4)-methyltransferase
MASGHRPVLYQEVLAALEPVQGRRYIDCTVGAGGHARGILEASSPDGALLGLDLDPQALQLARTNLEDFAQRAHLVLSSYTLLRQRMAELGWNSVSGIILDLGLSSMQLDTPERGFSFQYAAPLDMRFDPDNSLTAAILVNQLDEHELANLIYRCGEEPQARRIAHAIVENRPVEDTQKLAEIILKVVERAKYQDNKRRTKSSTSERPDKKRIHPATRTFQALRIAVNHELENLEMVLPEAVTALESGGRLAVISFHSLEDRIVKQFFRRESQDCICPPRQPVCTCGHQAILRELTRRPVQPQAEELAQNARSRSARMRVAEKLPPSARRAAGLAT